MEQKFEELKKENNDQATEYAEFIKSSVNDGSYFKDAVGWYYFRYVSPICDRTLLIFGSIVAAVVLVCLFQMINGAFPLVQKVPIFIKSKDQSQYFPNLVEIKAKKGKANYDPQIETVDEAVLKYLVIDYVKSREEYNYSKAEIEEINKKFNHIRNNSDASEYRAFQLFMSKDNPESPILNFGQKVVKSIQIESFSFNKKVPQDFASKARDFLSNKIPTDAEVRFVAITKTNDEQEVTTEKKERFVAKIKFVFGGVDKSQTDNLNFMVSEYKLFKVQ